MAVLLRRFVPLMPVVLLLALTGAGLANALQEDAGAPDLGPQPADYNGDIAGYLVGAAEYRAAPHVPVGEEIEFRVFGCAEASKLTVSVVPRLLGAEEAAANDALADDDPAKLAQEPVIVVDETDALADGSAYPITVPENVPNGFARIRTDCADADANPLTSDTVIDVVIRADFEAAQADAEEPAELATAIDGKQAAEPVEPAAPAETATAAPDEGLATTGVETTMLVIIGATIVAMGAMLAVYSRRFRQI